MDRHLNPSVSRYPYYGYPIISFPPLALGEIPRIADSRGSHYPTSLSPAHLSDPSGMRAARCDGGESGKCREKRSV